MDVLQIGDVAVRLDELSPLDAEAISAAHQIFVAAAGSDAVRTALDPAVLSAIRRMPPGTVVQTAAVEVLVRENNVLKMVPRGTVTSEFYIGPFAEPPLTGPAGSPLTTGMTYFNTSFNEMQVYSAAGAWISYGTPVPARMRVFIFRPLTSMTIISGLDVNGDELSFMPDDLDNVQVYVNGALLDQDAYTLQEEGDTIVMVDPVGLGDVVQVFCANRQEFATELLPVGIDTGSWVFDGTATTFPLRDGLGRVLNAATTYQLMLSQKDPGAFDGRLLNPATAYTASMGTVTFTTPPPAGAVIFGTYGHLQQGPAEANMLMVATETALEVAPGIALAVSGDVATVVDIGAVSVAPVLPTASSTLLGHFILIGPGTTTPQTLHICRMAGGAPSWAQVGLS